MKNTADFLDALRVKLNLPSDGQLADYLGMHRQHVSRYRTLAGTFDDAMAMKVADILEIDPAFVVASMHAQRAKRTEEKKLWERIATSMAGMAAALAVIVFLPFIQLEPGMMHTFDNNNVQNIHYAKYAILIILSLIIAALYISRSYRNDPHAD